MLQYLPLFFEKGVATEINVAGKEEPSPKKDKTQTRNEMFQPHITVEIANDFTEIVQNGSEKHNDP